MKHSDYESDVQRAAGTVFRFRQRHGLQRSEMASLLGVSADDISALEDFYPTAISPKLLDAIIVELESDEAGLAECIRLQRLEKDGEEKEQIAATADGVLDYLRRSPSGATRSQLLRKFRVLRQNELNMIVNNYIDLGHVERIEAPPECRIGVGRPSTIYRAISPLV